MSLPSLKKCFPYVAELFELRCVGKVEDNLKDTRSIEASKEVNIEHGMWQKPVIIY